MVRSFLRNGRKHYWTGSSRERHDHARRQSSNTAIASFARAAVPGVRHQPQDCRQVAQAGGGRGYEDWADGAAIYYPERDRGHCRVALKCGIRKSTKSMGGVDKTWGSCGACSVYDGQPTIENCGPCDGYSVSPFGRPPHPSALSHAGIGNVID